MVQVLFPVYPEGIKMINSSIGVNNIEDIGIFYFNEAGPIYHHLKNDYKSFRYITSQMMELKLVRQIEVVRCFKISPESAKRWLKVYRRKGGEGFFGTRNTRQKGKILNEETVKIIESKLRQEKTIKEISQELGIKPDTIKKGIQSNRIITPAVTEQKNTHEFTRQAKTQSQRSQEDSQSPMGMGCTDIEGRVEASLKKK